MSLQEDMDEFFTYDFEFGYSSYGPDEDAPESGFVVNWFSPRQIEITEWQNFLAATGDYYDPDDEDPDVTIRIDTVVTLDELLDPKGKHRGVSGHDMQSGMYREYPSVYDLYRAAIDGDEEKVEDVIVGAALGYIGYWGGEESIVDGVGE